MKQFIKTLIKKKRILIMIIVALMLGVLTCVAASSKETEMTSTIQKEIEGQEEIEASNTKVQETILYQDKLVAEDFLVGWIPIEISEVINTFNRNVYIPKITSVKKSYTEEDIIEENGEITFKEEKSNGKVRPGERIFYEIIVTNIGDNDLENISVYDTVPEKTELLKADNAKVKDNTICWNIDIPKNSEVKLIFSVTVNKDAEGAITNVAIVDGEETNVVENKVIKPDISAKKTSTPISGSKVKYDDIITYTITVENKGDDSKEVVITDDIPDNTVFYAVENGRRGNKRPYR